MANIMKPEDQEQQSSMATALAEKKLGQQPLQQTQSLAPTSSYGSSQIQAQQAVPQVSTKVGSGTFTNIRKYIQANQPKVASTIQKIGKTYSDASEKVKQDLQAKQQQYAQQVQGEEQRVGVGNQSTQEQQIRDTIERAGLDKNVPLTQEQFQSFRLGQIDTGTVPDLTPEQMEVQRLQNIQSGLANAGTRKQILQEAFKSPTYNRGLVGLDELLISGDKANRRALQQQVTQGTAGIGQQLSSTQSDIDKRKVELEKAAANLSDVAKQHLGTVRSSIESQLKAEQERKQAIMDMYTKNIGQEKDKRIVQDVTENTRGLDLNSDGKVDYEESLKALGYEAGQQTYGANIKSLLDRKLAQSGYGNVATQEQINRDLALSQLGDSDYSRLSSQDKEDIYDPAVALKRQIDMAKEGYESEYNPAKRRSDFAEAYYKGHAARDTSGRLQHEIDKLVEERRFAEMDSGGHISPEQRAEQLKDPTSLSSRILALIKQQEKFQPIIDKEFAIMNDMVSKYDDLGVSDVSTNLDNQRFSRKRLLDEVIKRYSGNF